jgi:hypothetical protein
VSDVEGERGGWRWAVGSVLGLVLLAHLRFLILDPRLPWDANLAFDQLPLVYGALAAGRLGDLLRLVFTETSAGYDLLLAVPMLAGAPRPLVLELAGLGWTFTALACAVVITRRLFGGPAAAMALALLASGWGVVVFGRTTWVHVPELALVLVVLTCLVLDPALSRWRSVALVAVAGAGAMGLRPSGAAWVISLLPLLLWGVLRGQPRRGAMTRLAAVGLVWGLGACPAILELAPYLQGKLARRGGYAHVVQWDVLLHQLNMVVGLIPLVVGLLGLGALAVSRGRGERPARRGPALLLVAWLLLGGLLVLVFRAGVDNFPAIAVALAVLAGGGLARLPRPFWVLPGLVFALHWGVQWLAEPEGDPGSPLLREWLQAQPGLAYRVDRRLDPAVVMALLDTSCPPARVERCVIYVDHGLFAPSPEEPGRLELFLADREHVELLPVYVPGTGRVPDRAHAFASFGCAALDQHWDQRRPGWRGTADRVQRGAAMRPIWERDLGGDCSYTWLTPRGVLRHAEALPD